MSLDQAHWLFALAVSLHMLEELIWLPAWSQKAGAWHQPVRTAEFIFATAVFLAALYLAILASLRAGPKSLCAYVTAGFALVMIGNVFVPHLGATLAQRRYAPGLATAVALNLPASAFLLWRLFTEGQLAVSRFALAAVVTLFAAVVIWPLLFRIGRRASAFLA